MLTRLDQRVLSRSPTECSSERDFEKLGLRASRIHALWAHMGFADMFSKTKSLAARLTRQAPVDIEHVMEMIGKPRARISIQETAEKALKFDSQVPSPTTVGTAFEIQSLEVLRNIGATCTRCGGTSDGGVDIEGFWHLPPFLIEIVAQCKASTTKTSVSELRDFNTALANHFLRSSTAKPLTLSCPPPPIAGRLGMFFSRVGFTKPALSFIAQSSQPLAAVVVSRSPNPNGILDSFTMNATARKLLPSLRVAQRVSPPPATITTVALMWNDVILAAHT
jgi:hypothetical protein